MRAVATARLAMGPEVRDHLDLCLDCLGLPTRLPLGCQYSKIIEPFKVAIQNSRPMATGPASAAPDPPPPLPGPGRVKAALGRASCQRMGGDRLGRAIGLTKIMLNDLRCCSRCSPGSRSPARRLPEGLPPSVPTARVAFFLGCVRDAMFPRPTPHGRVCSSGTAARSSSRRPRPAACRHPLPLGDEGPALELARRTSPPSTPTSSTPSSSTPPAAAPMYSEDYEHLLMDAEHESAARGSSPRSRTSPSSSSRSGPIAPTHPLPMKVTYHDACHLRHGQQVPFRAPPAPAMIPGVQLVPLEESELCCCAAGTYNRTQPESRERLGRRKMDHIAATGARRGRRHRKRRLHPPDRPQGQGAARSRSLTRRPARPRLSRTGSPGE